MPGFCFFKSSILFSTSGVATRGLEPPITPGRMEPVSWYRFRILETQPWETRRFREMTHGRTPAAAISTIFRRMWFGRGRPLMNTPPSWFTRPWPSHLKEVLIKNHQIFPKKYFRDIKIHASINSLLLFLLKSYEKKSSMQLSSAKNNTQNYKKNINQLKMGNRIDWFYVLTFFKYF